MVGNTPKATIMSIFAILFVVKHNQVKRNEGVNLKENKALLNRMSVDEVLFFSCIFFIILYTKIGCSAFVKDGIGDVQREIYPRMH